MIHNNDLINRLRMFYVFYIFSNIHTHSFSEISIKLKDNRIYSTTVKSKRTTKQYIYKNDTSFKSSR